jgi:hypothetical protein
MNRNNNPVFLFLIAFLGGFLSVLIFHQPMLAILKAAAFAPDKLVPYAMTPTTPFGIARTFSLAFWGGIWGLLLAVALSWTRGLSYWLSGFILGALGPSLINWFIVLPLKGEPVGGGWAFPGVATALIINGVWGLGTALLFRLLGRSLLASNKPNSLDNLEEESRERINR